MNDQSGNLSAEQSLHIITSMIRQAQGKAQRNTFFFLLWGWVVALANLGMFVLSMAKSQYSYAVWAITIPAWIYTLYKAFKREETKTTTHFDAISGCLWISFGICIFTIVAFGYKINYNINPVILLFSAIPTFVSGMILRFKPLMIGGVTFWIAGIVSFLTPWPYQSLVGAVAITCGYLIPGYMLKNKKD
jgi:hypothetical protein